MSQELQTSLDAFLGGKVQIEQPVKGYRAATDPVILAASIPARSEQTILDIGCGVGTLGLCLAARVSGLKLVGIELQPEYAELAKSNVRRNSADFTIFQADFFDDVIELKSQNFDHVCINPPFFEGGRASASPVKSKDIANRSKHSMEDWIKQAAKRVKPKGTFSIIQKADELGNIMAAMYGRFGGISVYPIRSRARRDAGRVVVQGVKGSRAGDILHTGLIMHDGKEHEKDGSNFTRQAEAILRDGAALDKNLLIE